MSIVVVGTVAFDSIDTIHGSYHNVLGGSATHFALAASFFTRPQLVSVVGDDFPEDFMETLQSRDLDLDGLEVKKGKTFRWHGRYHADMNQRDTLDTQLGLYGDYSPVLPEAYRQTDCVFLANGLPAMQSAVLDQVESPKLVFLDTMNLWIDTALDDLKAVLKRVDGVVLNDSEAQQLTGLHNTIAAAHKLHDFGPRFVVVKKGEHGALATHDGQTFVLPAFPTDAVIDPTGAGDTFAGGMLGSLVRDGLDQLDFTKLRRAVAYGVVMGSFNVEGVTFTRLMTLTRSEIDHRLREFANIIDIPF